jgi:hypothetical protein
MTPLKAFCRAVRARSYENAEAIRLLHSGGVTSQVVSILRQEVDSLVRVMYLLSITDMSYQEQLIKESIEGRQWRTKDGKKKITDREMVELANTMHGWTSSVYKFGCAFIHLLLATARKGGKTVMMADGPVEGGDDGGEAQRAW